MEVFETVQGKLYVWKDDKEEEGKREKNAFIGTNSRTIKYNGGKSAVVFLSCFCIKQIKWVPSGGSMDVAVCLFSR